MAGVGGPGRQAALDIHRRVPMPQWRQALEALPAELQAEAEEYLSGIVACWRNLRALAIEAGCKSLREFDALRREARRAGAPSAVAYHRAGRPERWRDGGVDT